MIRSIVVFNKGEPVIAHTKIRLRNAGVSTSDRSQFSKESFNSLNAKGHGIPWPSMNLWMRSENSISGELINCLRRPSSGQHVVAQNRYSARDSGP